MNNRIIERKEIELNDQQTKMLISGWGKNVYEDSVVEKITYLSDGLKIKGYLAYPTENRGKKFSCIIWNRGGYENKGAIDKFNARGIYGQIASWGYIVFASQYRGNAGSEGKEELGGRDVNDILNLIPLAAEFKFADKDKWGIEGWSRGGMMTYLTLLKNPSFKCAVLIGAISDFKGYAESNTSISSIYKKIIGEEDFERKLSERTILNFTGKLPPIPYLLIHGLSDKTVPASQTIDMARKFYELSRNYRLVLLEEGDHYLKKHRRKVDEIRKMWFDRYLR